METAAAVMARASGENFPVASRLLPRRPRAHLLALYGFARLADELGDGPPPGVGTQGAVGARAGALNAGGINAGDLNVGGVDAGGLDAGDVLALTPSGEGGDARPGDAQARLAALDELERDLDRAYRGEARHPLLVRLQPALRECALPREPFARLIEANRVDQRVSRYETWEQLRGYCALSANPVGELVLGIFGQATPERVALSDSICTALQLTEHCQDVAEDRDRGRVYLPAEDLDRFGCTVSELSAAHAGGPLRAVLAFEVRRARGLFADGAALIRRLEGVRERLAVAAFVAGGRAALEAIERAGYDVLAGPPRAGTGRRLRVLGATLAERRR